MRRLNNKILAILACLMLILSCFSCSAGKVLNFDDQTAKDRIFFTIIGDDGEKAHENFLLTATDVINSLSDSNEFVKNFNFPKGEIFEGEENILGEREKYVRVQVNRRIYDASLEAKRMYALTDGMFNICSYRLTSEWHSGTIPSDECILIETMGVSNPLLINESLSSGKYYLTKNVNPEQDGTITKEHTRLSFNELSYGFALDCALGFSDRYNISGVGAQIGNVAKFVGKGPYSDGKWKFAASTGNEKLFEIAVPGGYSIAVKDVKENSLTINELFIGSVIDPVSGVPTTLNKTDNGEYCQKSDYAVYVAVIAKTATEAQALCSYAMINGEKSADKLDKAAYGAVMFTLGGKAYVTGNAAISISGKFKNQYEIVKL